MVSQQQANQQCTQLRAQADGLKAIAAHCQRQHRAVQHQQLAMTDTVQQPQEHGAQQGQQQQECRVRRRLLGAQQGQHADREQVLDDQYPDRDATVKGP